MFNRKKVKLMAIFTAMAMILTLLPLAAMAQTPEDARGHWAQNWIDKMIQKGFVSGYPDGTFQPDKQITRAEFATIVNNSFNTYDASAEATFTDVSSSDWFYRQVASAKEAGYISGYPDGTFKPNAPISRQEAAVLMTNLLGLNQNASLPAYTDQGQIGNWAVSSISAVNASGLMQGYPDGQFKPLNPISRAETAVLIDKALGYDKVAPSTSYDVTEEIKLSLAGKVLYNYEAQSDAKVRLFATESVEVIAESKTDSFGSFSFEVKAGNYDLTVEKDGKLGYLKNVNVNDEDIVIELQSAVEVKGKLTDSAGKSLDNTDVAFTTNPTFLTKTNSQGEYSLFVLPDRKYTIRAVNPDKASEGFRIIKEDVAVGQQSTSLDEIRASFSTGAIRSGGGGGGGGGSSTSPATSTNVNSTDGLKRALENSNIRTINFTGNINGDLNVEAKGTNKTINFASYTLEGNLTIRGSSLTSVTLNGDSDQSIDGNLTVNTPKATVNNNVTVSGDITIDAIKPNTWNERANNNKLKVNAPTRIIIAPGVSVKKAIINAEVTVTGADYIEEAEINDPKVVLDYPPKKITLGNNVDSVKIGTKTYDNDEIETLNNMAIKNLKATPGDRKVTLEWESTEANGYLVDVYEGKKTENWGTGKLKTVDTFDLFAIVSELQNGKTYTFKVYGSKTCDDNRVIYGSYSIVYATPNGVELKAKNIADGLGFLTLTGQAVAIDYSGGEDLVSDVLDVNTLIEAVEFLTVDKIQIDNQDVIELKYNDGKLKDESIDAVRSAVKTAIGIAQTKALSDLSYDDLEEKLGNKEVNLKLFIGSQSFTFTLK
ncbi:hypothetical protein F9B85_03940 [Heliorestis acidaminivorans]|uniref:SLH domain-containing protein n=1 Tax=Heliorestis acidaminivorans TaxID=553427 RepID=A0A6I0F8F1_9FIRM|nr:S-layer homology domain-containing protein [Heliorestis acidaminivorans]KAB2953778.1 hypothetical protein F9B85_03940 [Heliorestis acidaminivorans]